MNTLSIFIDESSQTAHRYLTLGALVVNKEAVPYLELAVRHFRYKRIYPAEMKWGKVSNSLMHVYKDVIDQFFDLDLAQWKAEFHMLVVDTHKRNDHLYNDGSREIGFNKEMYQLLLKCARVYKGSRFEVHADHRETSIPIEELRTILNAGCKKNRISDASPFRRLHHRNSKHVISLQLVDILLGAVTYRINGHHLAKGASPSKMHLSGYLLERCAIIDPMEDCHHSKFSLWHRKLKVVPQGQGSATVRQSHYSGQ